MPSSIWTIILAKIHESPEEVKDLVIRRYQKPIYEFARLQRFGHEDAEDIAQAVFLEVCRSTFLEKAERKKGKFRSYLLGLTQHVIARFREHELAGMRDRRRTVALGDFEIPAEVPSNADFKRVWAGNLHARALEEAGDGVPVRAYKLKLEEKSYREIAAELGISETDVTNYIHRVKELLRKTILRLVAEYCDPDDVPGEIDDLGKDL